MIKYAIKRNVIRKNLKHTAFGTMENSIESDIDLSMREVICDLCKQFYGLGWVSGTGGGLSIKTVDDHIFVAPSGVQKERIQPNEIFVFKKSSSAGDDGGEMIMIKSPDPKLGLKPSDCMPVFMSFYRLRGAGAVIHSHGLYVNLVTLIDSSPMSSSSSLKSGSPSANSTTSSMKSTYVNSTSLEFQISCQEMIKGIMKGSSGTYHEYDDVLTVPIVENTPHDRDLAGHIEKTLVEYPDTNAVLVHGHGVYVWGPTWIKAKGMAECYHYLFELAIKMKQLRIKPVE